MLHQLWFWFSNLFHIFFSFIEFCLRVFNIRLLVCGSALLISFFLGLSLLPLMKCQFLHYICCPMKSSFWLNWSCPGDLFCIFGFLAPFALFYLSLSLSLSHTHTHTHTHMFTSLVWIPRMTNQLVKVPFVINSLEPWSRDDSDLTFWLKLNHGPKAFHGSE